MQYCCLTVKPSFAFFSVPHYQHRIKISWPASKWLSHNLSVNWDHHQLSRGHVNRQWLILLRSTLRFVWRIKIQKNLFYLGPSKQIWPFARLKFYFNFSLKTCDQVFLFSVFTSHVIKIKIVTIQLKKSRVWDTIDDWYINKLAKNQLPAVFHLRVICRSVSPEFIELCMETACLCPSEGHKHGGRNVTETSVTEFCYWNTKLLL